jgi:ketosteroid isomerase-like protein
LVVIPEGNLLLFWLLPWLVSTRAPPQRSLHIRIAIFIASITRKSRAWLKASHRWVLTRPPFRHTIPGKTMPQFRQPRLGRLQPVRVARRLALHLRLCACCLILPAAFSSSPAFARQAQAQSHHAPRQVREQIADLEEQWRLATLNGDAAAMDRLLSEDYVGISWTGQVNTKQMQLERTRKRMVAIKSMELSDMKVKVVGPVAIVTSRAEVEGTNEGSVIDGAFRYTRVYQRLPGGRWQITNFEVTRIPKNRRDHNPPPPPNSPPAP